MREGEENTVDETMATKRRRVHKGSGVEEEEEKPRGKASSRTFSSLPDEMKAKVFSYLDKKSLYRSTLVCKYWFKVAKDWLGLRKKVILSPMRLTLEESVQVIIDNSTHLMSVTLMHWNDEDGDLLLKVVGGNLPHLKRLIVSNMLVPQKTLELISREFSKLKDISLRRFKKNENYLRHPLDILSVCRELEKITIDGRCYPPNKATGEDWPKLTDVSLLMGFADREVEILAPSLGGQLTKLTIEFIINLESFLLLAHFPQLEELEIQDCLHLTDAGLEDGIGKLRNLRSLNLVKLYSCTAQALERFFSNPNIVGSLEKLSIFGCSKLNQRSLSAIAMNCPLLSHFCLKETNQVTNAPLLDLVRRCRNLQYLRLIGCRKLDLSAEALGQFQAVSSKLQICASP